MKQVNFGRATTTNQISRLGLHLGGKPSNQTKLLRSNKLTMKKLTILISLFLAHFGHSAVFVVINNTTNTWGANTMRIQSVGSGPAFQAINSVILNPGDSAALNSGTYWNTYDCYGYNSATGQRLYPTNDIPDGAAGATWYIGPEIPACSTFTKTVCLTNTGTSARYAEWWFNKGLGSESRTASGLIAPGASACDSEIITVCTNGSSDTFEAGWVDFVAQPQISTNGTITFVETNIYTGVVTATPNGDPAPVGGTVGPTNGVTPSLWSQNTNSIINFTGVGSTTARDDTLKAGFNVLAEQLIGIKKAIDLNTSQTGGGGGTGDNSDITSAIDSFHQDNTNALSGIGGILSLGTNYTGSSAGTNGTAAGSEAESIMGSGDDHADSVLTDLGSAPSLLTGGSATALSFGFAGTTLNLDPENIFPGAAGFFKAGIMLLTALWLGRYLVDLYLKTATVFATSQTGGVPALGPWGSVGLPIALAVAIAVVGLWVVVFAALFTYGLDYLSTIGSTAGGFTTSNGTAIYLLNLFFPISFVLSAAWTRLIAPFAVTKLVIMTASAQRFLLGK